MPDRIFGKDEELAKHFTAQDLTGQEYANEGHLIDVRCKHCKARWGLKVGDMGEVSVGYRNSLLAHSKAHENDSAAKVRSGMFRLPSAQ